MKMKHGTIVHVKKTLIKISWYMNSTIPQS